MLFFEVGIEDHGEVADEDAAERGGADFVGGEEDQAVFAEGFEVREFVGEVAVEVDCEFLRDFVLEDDGVAEQAADDGAAEAVVFGEAVAAHGGDAAVVDGFCLSGDVAMVLRVGVSDAADGGDAHAVEVGAGLGGVALKIAVQRAILLRDGQFVAGFREVVHADVEVAGVEKFDEAGAENFEFFHAFGQMAWRRRLAVF